MYILIMAAIIFVAVKVLSASSAKAKQNKGQAELARVKAEQIRQREELKRQQAEARAWTQRQIALEQQAMRREREEAEAWRKQQEWNAKQEALSEKMISRIERCEDTIAHHSELFKVYSARLTKAESNLEEVSDKLLVLTITLEKASESNMHIPSKQIEEMNKDIQKLEKQKEQLENKVISLKNQKFATEQKIKKAEADKAEAERKIA